MKCKSEYNKLTAVLGNGSSLARRSCGGGGVRQRRIGLRRAGSDVRLRRCRLRLLLKVFLALGLLGADMQHPLHRQDVAAPGVRAALDDEERKAPNRRIDRL